jgi:hypothetical protein
MPRWWTIQEDRIQRIEETTEQDRTGLKTGHDRTGQNSKDRTNRTRL